MLFVNVYQMLSILLFSALPMYVVYHGPVRMQLYDLPLAVLFCAFLVIETLSDYEMLVFQEGKQQQIRRREFKQAQPNAFLEGFYCLGMYRFSRHPNYFGELGQWLTVYLLSCVSFDKTVCPNWTVVGFLNLCAFFYKFMNLTEGITNFGYPKYKVYARRTSQLLLWFPGAVQTKEKKAQ